MIFRRLLWLNVIPFLGARPLLNASGMIFCVNDWNSRLAATEAIPTMLALMQAHPEQQVLQTLGLCAVCLGAIEYTRRYAWVV